MSLSVLKMKAELKTYKSALKRKDAENKRLREALGVLLARNDSDAISDTEMAIDEADLYEEMLPRMGDANEDSVGDEEDMDEGDLLEPIHGDDNLYYCPKCIREIDDGYCFDCGTEYQWLVDETSRDSVSTLSQALRPDRSLVPRGDTPLREIVIAQLEVPPAKYRHQRRENEYRELIRRGATPLMCETFHLEFSYSGGIYAWADDEIFREFSGSLMRPGDVWKIHLGRRISLDADDLDGSAFIDGLLEDALLYPHKGSWTLMKHESWHTVQEAPGIWVTRLQALKPDGADTDEMSEADREADNEDYDPDKILESCPPAESIIRPDQYSVSDDDLENASDIEDLGFFNPEGRDTVWDSGEEEVDELVDEDQNSNNVSVDDGPIEQEMDKEDDDVTIDDSDEAGSDFESDEVLSGDEQLLADAKAFFAGFPHKSSA